MSSRETLDSAADATATATRDEPMEVMIAAASNTLEDDAVSPLHAHTIHKSSIEIGTDATTYNRILDANASVQIGNSLECSTSDITKASPLTLAFKFTSGGVLTSDEIMKQIDQWMTAAPKSAVAYSVSILNPTPETRDSKETDSDGCNDDDSSHCQSTHSIALPDAVMQDEGHDFENQSNKAGDDNIAHRPLHDGTNGLVNSYGTTISKNTIVSDGMLFGSSTQHIEPQSEVHACPNSSTMLPTQISRQSNNVSEVLDACEDTNTSPSGGSENLEEPSRSTQQIDTHTEDSDNANSECRLKGIGGVRNALADIEEEDRHQYEGRSISSIRNSLYLKLDRFWQAALHMLMGPFDAGIGILIYSLEWYEDGLRDYSHLDPGWDSNYEDHDPELAEAARAFLTDLQAFKSRLEAIDTELRSQQRRDYYRELELDGQGKLETARFLVRCRQFEPVLRAAPFEDRIV